MEEPEFYEYPDMIWGEELRPLGVEVWDKRTKALLSFEAAAVSIYLADGDEDGEKVIDHLDALVTVPTNPMSPTLWWDGVMGIPDPEVDTTYHVYWHLTRAERPITLPWRFKWVVKPSR